MSTTVGEKERIMVGVYLKDRIRTVGVRRMTGVTDVGDVIWILQWNWAGHLCRRNDRRWSQKIINRNYRRTGRKDLRKCATQLTRWKWQKTEKDGRPLNNEEEGQ